MTIKITLIVVLIILSGFFSATETAFSSLNRVRLKSMATSGNKKAVKVLAISAKFEKFLTTVLIGNNIVNIACTAISTILFIEVFENEQLGTLISTIVITILVLIFGEITPKSLAKENPESFALFICPLVTLMMFILTPINLIFSGWKFLISKMFKVKKHQSITEDEVLTIVDEAALEGTINENEKELIKNVFDFDEGKVEAILTPRIKIKAVRIDDDLKQITQQFKKSGYSRLPVYETTIDNIIGTINYKDFYNIVASGKEPLETIIKKPVFVTEYMKISKLLKLLKENRSHMAIVKDEFDGTIGLVTMEDILEEIVGDIWDEHDEVEEQIIKISENEYKVKGNAYLENLFGLFKITSESDQITFNGWALSHLGYIPAINETFKIDDLAIKVLNANDKMIIEALITKVVSEEENES